MNSYFILKDILKTKIEFDFIFKVKKKCNIPF